MKAALERHDALLRAAVEGSNGQVVKTTGDGMMAFFTSARDGVSVSAWMTAAARIALQRRAGLAAVALWEKQHGRFTTEEMNEARRSVRAQLRTSRTVRRSA